jgi:hypothetical protein
VQEHIGIQITKEHRRKEDRDSRSCKVGQVVLQASGSGLGCTFGSQEYSLAANTSDARCTELARSDYARRRIERRPRAVWDGERDEKYAEGSIVMLWPESRGRNKRFRADKWPEEARRIVWRCLHSHIDPFCFRRLKLLVLCLSSVHIRSRPETRYRVSP